MRAPPSGTRSTTGAAIADGLFGSQPPANAPSESAQTCQGPSAASSPNCAKHSPRQNAVSPTASSIWCCSRSAPTTSIFPGWLPTSSWTCRPSARCFAASSVMASLDDARGALTRDMPQGFCQAARGAQTAGRRHVASGLHVLRQPDAVIRRHAVSRRTRRLRYPSLVQRRAAAARRGLELRRKRIPAAAESARAVPVRHPVPQSARRSHDLCRRASSSICRSRLLRARANRPGIRSAMLFGHRRQFRSRSRQRRQPTDALRPQRRRIPRLSATRALDP